MTAAHTARSSDPDASSYPDAEVTDVVDVLHGVAVPDPYRWLEDVADPRTGAWSSAQAQLFTAHVPTWAARAPLAAAISARLRTGGVSAPAWRGERQFFLRRDPEQEMAVLLTVDPDGTERVLLDPLAIDPTGRTTLDSWQPSKDGALLAYQLSAGGSEESVLRVIDVVTMELLDGPIDRARYSPVAWLVTKPGTPPAFYYVRRLAPELVPDTEQQYHRRVYLHTLGDDPATDVEVFGPRSGSATDDVTDPLPKTTYYGVSVSRDGRWLQVSAAEGTSPRNDLWLADLAACSTSAPVWVTVQRGVDARTGMHVGRDGRGYVFTDLDAPRGRYAVCLPTAPQPEHWIDLIPQHVSAVLEDVALLSSVDSRRQSGANVGNSSGAVELPSADDVLLVAWTEHAVSRLSVHDLATGQQTGTVELPGLGSISGLVERPEGGPSCWFSYTDHATPGSVLQFDAASGTTSTWASPPGEIIATNAVAKQVVVTSADGTPVHMFVIHRDDLVLHTEPDGSLRPDTTSPTILYGYGGFNISMTPGYSASIVAWVEAGGVWAVANLRGGAEEGEQWHRAGMLANKQNVFDDCHAAARWLRNNGWAGPGQLGVEGGSNGGLLVGAVITQHPELYDAAVCSAPLLDMVRFESSGLGATWAGEYGSAAVAEEFRWLHAYSPYHHVVAGTEYPPTLFTTFDGDSRVDPMHARKMCAALQHADPTRIRPVLLRAEVDVGHGARSVSRSVELSADGLGFLAHHLGLSFAAAPSG